VLERQGEFHLCDSVSLFLSPWLDAKMSEALLLEVTEVTGVTVLPILQRWLKESVSLSVGRSAPEKREVEEALVVARAADKAERGGRGSGILIGESRTRVLLSRHVLGTKATEVTEDPPEEPVEQEQQTPPRRRSRCTTRSQTTLAAPLERPRRGGHPTPRSQVIHYDMRKAPAR
jgi:hypothetical protein